MNCSIIQLIVFFFFKQKVNKFMQNISICKFPTKVICVDDNESFLQGLELVVNHINCNFISFSNPHLVEDYLINSTHDLNFLKKDIAINIDENDLLSIDLHINCLYKEIYSPERFNRLSLFITDYDMPGVNGLDLCKKLQNTSINRVLLTGVADESIAIKAFNDGIIEQFIKKQDGSIINNINTLITKSQNRYFNHISNNYKDLLNNKQKFLDILLDSTFISLFNEIIEKEEIIEYYLLDTSGSYLMLTKDGEVSALYITTAKQREEIFTFAQYENCPNEILDELQNNNKTLWFYQSSSIEDIAWEQHLLQLNSLNTENSNLYYSYTKSVPFVDKEKIISFNQYKSSSF